MTSINSFLTIFTIPTIVNVALGVFMGKSSPLQMPFWTTVLQILLITVIPCVIGIVIRARNEAFTKRVERPLKIAMPIMLAFAMLAAIFLEKKPGVKIELHEYLDILPWVFLLNAAAMFVGWGVAGLLRLGKANMLTIGVEVGLQNSGLAIAVATSAALLHDPRLAIPASTYALFSFFTAIAFGLIVRPPEGGLRGMFKAS